MEIKYGGGVILAFKYEKKRINPFPPLHLPGKRVEKLNEFYKRWQENIFYI